MSWEIKFKNLNKCLWNSRKDWALILKNLKSLTMQRNNCSSIPQWSTIFRWVKLKNCKTKNNKISSTVPIRLTLPNHTFPILMRIPSSAEGSTMPLMQMSPELGEEILNQSTIFKLVEWAFAHFMLRSSIKRDKPSLNLSAMRMKTQDATWTEILSSKQPNSKH